VQVSVSPLISLSDRKPKVNAVSCYCPYLLGKLLRGTKKSIKPTQIVNKSNQSVK